MKKLLAVLFFLLILLPLSFAAGLQEGKTYVTKEKTATFNFDLGLSYTDFDENKESTAFGLYSAATFSPASVGKFNIGIKAESDLTKMKDGKHLNFGGMIAVRRYVRKSFEIITGLGAKFLIWDIESANRFSHGWGLIAQGGARGRLNNWLAVGVQIEYFKGFGNLSNSIQAQLYCSFETN